MVASPIVTYSCAKSRALSAFLSKNVYFSQEGKPQQKYYKHDDGRIEFFPSEMDAHPMYGEPLQFVTPEIVKEAELEKQGYHIVSVESSPTNADVYLGWKHSGKTPIKLKLERSEDFLVVALKGYIPQYQKISPQKNERVSFNLSPGVPGALKRFLVVVREDLSQEDVADVLRLEFTKQKLSICGIDEQREFRQHLDTLGATPNEALLAWARAKLAVDVLVIVRVTQQTRELSSINVGYPQIQESLKGLYRVETYAETEVIDTITGQTLLSFPTDAVSTSVAKSMSAKEALAKASSQIVHRIKQELL
jgi:hypothetical protein